MPSNVTHTTPPDDIAGAMALVRDCIAGCRGERLLVVNEPEHSKYYDHKASKLTANAARSMGLSVYETECESYFSTPEEQERLLNSFKGFDHVVFFSRIGDQIRFSQDPNMPSSTMCYALNPELLNSEFGTACHQGMCDIKKVIDAVFTTAEEIRITCPRGTDYRGSPDWHGLVPNEVTLKRFPMLVPQPVTATGMSGKIALSRFLVGTGSRYYEPYFLELPSDVYACINDKRISHFEGEPADVEKVETHYLNVSNKFSIAPWHVDSWHAGIHPGCHFTGDAESDIMRWAGSAFGSPRILHFHTCGEYAPGEISWNILDPTIHIDDVPLWEDGRLYPDRVPQGREALAKHPNLAKLYANPYRAIGLAS